jgi:hypothetical protein
MPPTPADSPTVIELQRAVADLENRLTVQQSGNTTRFAQLESVAATRFRQLESRMDEVSAKLAEVPSTQQIVGAMEQLLAKTMTSLDDRLTTQAQSIDVLKNTVSQTDSLLERVLESLDSLQTYAEPGAGKEDSLLHPSA